MNLLTTIEVMRDAGIFSDLDIHFAKFMVTRSNCTNEALLLGATLASHFTHLGSSCADLNALAEQKFPPQFENKDIETLYCPILSEWLECLQTCGVVGQPGDYTPLILDKHRLYLYRYYYYEQRLATQIHFRTTIASRDVNYDILEEGLSRLFFTKEPNYKQTIAAITAVLRKFCVISGGPGTGKTSTVIKVLALLLEQNPNLNIALAAPTGKAAARLQETVTQALADLNSTPSIKAAIPQESHTIHRLLGSRPDSQNVHAGNHLAYDVVVIDEASMVDLALMAKLAQAIPKTARWILLGDKDQLASVETGTVLGDICEVGSGKRELESVQTETFNFQTLFSNCSLTGIQNSIVLLDKNYRFSEDSGIRKLALAVKQGQGEEALRILKSENYPDVNWHHLRLSSGLPATLQRQVMADFIQCLQANQPQKVFQVFEQSRILCATRRGHYGVEAINRKIEYELRAKGLIRTNSRWYHGRPIMITHNNYSLKLFNGEVGIILRNLVGHSELQAFFLAQDGQIRAFWPNRLPEHETVYAMTIHKSQGSEFDNILILLPTQASKVLSRELIYTGITRARKSVHIWGVESVFLTAVSQKITRSSGLGEQLYRLSKGSEEWA